jgi:hypothetical protein
VIGERIMYLDISLIDTLYNYSQIINYMNWYYWIQANRPKVFGVIFVIVIPVLLFSKSELLKSFCLGFSSVGVLYFIGLGIEKLRNRKYK